MQRHPSFSLFLLLSFMLLCFMLSPVAAFGQMLSYSSYLNAGYAQNPALTGPIAVNGTGETCVFGPTALSELRNDGSVIYSVSNPFSYSGFGAFVAIDAQGNCYVVTTGTVTTTAGAFQTVPKQPSNPQFVVKVNGSGTVVYATYLGGSGGDTPGGIAVDGSGNVYITGQTFSNDYPTLNAFQSTLAVAPDAYITALNATGTALLYSTYWGGNGGDEGEAIAIDATSNAYVTGVTSSTNFPTVTPFQGSLMGTGTNAFVIKLNSTGTPIYSTYLGGSGGSSGTAISADANGNAYVAAQSGPGFPLVNPIQSSTGDTSVSVSQLNSTGSALVYSTYLGELTYPVGIQVDSDGQAYVAGSVIVPTETSIESLPLAAPIQSSFGAGARDSFVSVLNASGASLLFSTYLGGDDDAPNGFGIDSAGSIYLSGYSDGEVSGVGTFPILNAANGVYFPLVYNGEESSFYPANQNFVAKIVLSSGPSLSHPATVDFTTDPQPVGSSTTAAAVLLANTSASVDVAISNLAINGDFSQTNNCPQTLLAATSCKFQVIFSPTAGGQRTGNITITDNAPGSPHVIALIGAGQVAQVGLAPTSLTFASQIIGTSSAAQNVTLSNTGTATLNISAISVVGNFSESNDCGLGVAATGSCQIAVVFTPSATGPRTGTLTIVDSASGSPQTVSLTGTGAGPGLGLGLPTGGSGSATVAAGATAAYTLSIGGAGLAGTASLTCTGAPTGADCSVPPTVNISSTSASNLNVSVTTTSRTLAALHSPTFRHLGSFWATALMGCMFFSLSGRNRRTSGRNRRRARRYLLFLPLMLALLLCGCSGGSNGGQTKPNGTPAGTYKLSVTATMGSTVQSTVLTLVVQ
jgi:Beta-propeller repeat/Abnormal spindle-like microcephaly-assoc'd, ASPM-SPD-2-Hydin